MADEKHNRRDPDWLHENDDLGHELDVVIAKYAASEPRPGLEERILANLRAEQTHGPVRIWWRWAIAGALAVVVVAGVALAWRWPHHHSQRLRNGPSRARKNLRRPEHRLPSTTTKQFNRMHVLAFAELPCILPEQRTLV